MLWLCLHILECKKSVFYEKPLKKLNTEDNKPAQSDSQSARDRCGKLFKQQEIPWAVIFVAADTECRPSADYFEPVFIKGSPLTEALGISNSAVHLDVAQREPLIA